jgi:hypothetical protein
VVKITVGLGSASGACSLTGRHVFKGEQFARMRFMDSCACRRAKLLVGGEAGGIPVGVG